MPGLVLRTVPGPGQQPGDYPLMGLIMPSLPRMLLENLSPSRARDGGGPTRTVGAAGVEENLERIRTLGGEVRLNQIRDEARALAPVLGLGAEFRRLDDIIGTLLGTRKAKLVTARSRAAARGEPYDTNCVERLIRLSKHLENVALPERARGILGGRDRATVTAPTLARAGQDAVSMLSWRP